MICAQVSSDTEGLFELCIDQGEGLSTGKTARFRLAAREHQQFCSLLEGTTLKALRIDSLERPGTTTIERTWLEERVP
jgi:hypothetical protein